MRPHRPAPIAPDPTTPDPTAPAPRPAALLTLLLAALLALTGTVAVGGPARAAVDCGCDSTGAWVEIDSRVPVSGALSPGKAYTLSTETVGSQIGLTVRRVADGVRVAAASVPDDAVAWGWSPDGDRFYTRYRLVGPASSQDVISLYDLTTGSATTAEVETFQVPSGAAVAFSPHGRWFQVNSTEGARTVRLQVVDVVTGQYVHDEAVVAVAAPGTPGTTAESVASGFSPDGDDRTFLRTYRDVNGQVQLLARNLATGRAVLSTVVQGDAFWQFSPCGDVLAVAVRTDPVDVTVTAVSTGTGTAIGRAVHVPASHDLALSTTTTSHVVVATLGTATATSVLGPNTAGTTCEAPAALASVAVTPTSVPGGGDAEGVVTLTADAPAGGLAVSLSASPAGAVDVPASVTVAAGSRTVTFPVHANDVSASTGVTVTARAGSVTRTATLTVTPPPVRVGALDVAPRRVPGGRDGATGTVTLTRAAPAGGIVVTLTSSAPAAQVPASVTVPAGATSATFPVTTTAVRWDLPVTLGAGVGAGSATTRLDVLTTDRGCNPPTVDAATQSVTVRSQASDADEATRTGCATTARLATAFTVGAGSTGLPEGAPVRLVLSLRLGGTLATGPALTDGSATAYVHTEYTLSDGVTERVGLHSVFEITQTQPLPGEGNLEERRTWNLGTPDTVVSSVDETTFREQAGPGLFQPDTGVLEAEYETTVGARLVVAGQVDTFAHGRGAGASAVADVVDSLHASSRPAPGFEGLEIVADGGPVNRPPNCSPASVTTAEDVAVTAGVACTDPEGADLARTVVTAPAHGTVAVTVDGGLTYTPEANWSGTDSFTVSASDGRATSQPVRVEVVVTPVNDAPVCANGTATTTVGKPVTLRMSCTDADGDALRYKVVVAPLHGTVSLVAADGTFTYRPAAGYVGPDTVVVAGIDGSSRDRATFRVRVRRTA